MSIHDRKVRTFASPARAAALPAVPSTREAGLPGFAILSWTMLLAPMPSPAASVERANAAANAALRDPAVLGRFGEASLEARAGSAADAAVFLRAEIAKWQPIARQSGVVLD